MVPASVFKDLNFESFFSSAPSQSRSFEENDPPASQGKNVVFSERVKVVEIPSAKYLSKKDKKALWYSEPGESVGKDKVSVMRQLLCVIEDHRDDDSNEQEDGDDQGFDHPEERRRLPVSAVLVEQKSQRESGIEDYEFIAKIYKQCSAHSTMKAQIRAMQDEQEAREYASKTSRVRRNSKKLFRRILVR